MTHIPVTGVSNGIDCLLLLIAWATIGYRIKHLGYHAIGTVHYIRHYFLYFAIFNAFMSLPCLFVYLDPSLFPAAMGWGYAVGNVFLLIALSYLSIMQVKIVPQWGRFEWLVKFLWISVNIVLTILNIWFIALHNQPTFNNMTGLTQFHIPAFVTPILGIVSLSAYLPGIVLFVMSSMKQLPGRRLRPILLAIGMFLIMIFGPLHAAASVWQVFLAADILNIVSLIFLAGGVVYKYSPDSDNALPVQTRLTPTSAANR